MTAANMAACLGHPGCMQEARCWYDGYRFGSANVYNPWSVINYLNEGCSPGIYWGNTSSSSVLGDLVAGADAETLGSVYTLLARGGGAVEEPLDPGVVFSDIGIREGALWSMPRDGGTEEDGACAAGATTGGAAWRSGRFPNGRPRPNGRPCPDEHPYPNGQIIIAYRAETVLEAMIICPFAIATPGRRPSPASEAVSRLRGELA